MNVFVSFKAAWKSDTSNCWGLKMISWAKNTCKVKPGDSAAFHPFSLLSGEVKLMRRCFVFKVTCRFRFLRSCPPSAGGGGRWRSGTEPCSSADGANEAVGSLAANWAVSAKTGVCHLFVTEEHLVASRPSTGPSRSLWCDINSSGSQTDRKKKKETEENDKQRGKMGRRSETLKRPAEEEPARSSSQRQEAACQWKIYRKYWKWCCLISSCQRSLIQTHKNYFSKCFYSEGTLNLLLQLLFSFPHLWKHAYPEWSRLFFKNS